MSKRAWVYPDHGKPIVAGYKQGAPLIVAPGKKLWYADTKRASAYQQRLTLRAPPATRGFYGPWRRSPKEQKVIETDVAAYGLHTTGTVTLINGVIQGSDYTMRIGRRIHMTSVQIRGYTAPNSQTNSALGMGRVLIVLDLQPNGGLATVANILREVAPTSMLQLDNRDRFRVLIDEQLALGSNSSVATQSWGGNPSSLIQRFHRCNYDVTFDGVGIGIGDIQTGALLLVTVGNSSLGGGLYHNLTASCRVRFTDA